MTLDDKEIVKIAILSRLDEYNPRVLGIRWEDGVDVNLPTAETRAFVDMILAESERIQELRAEAWKRLAIDASLVLSASGVGFKTQEAIERLNEQEEAHNGIQG